MAYSVPRIDFISIILLFGVFQTVTLAFIFLSSNRRYDQVLIGLSMTILTIIGAEYFLNYSGYIQYASWLINLSAPLVLLLGPLSYLQAKSILQIKSEWKTNLLHIIPFAFFFVYSFFFFLQPEAYKINEVFEDFHLQPFLPNTVSLFRVDPLNIRGLIIVEGQALHLFCYSIGLIIVLVKARSEKRFIKLKIDAINTEWLVFWTICLGIGSIIFLLSGGVVNGYVIFKSLLPGYSVNIFCVAISYAAVIFWVSRSVLPRLSSLKYSKSKIDPGFQQVKLSQLASIMVDQKPYRNSDFSLRQLSELAKTKPHHVSQVINAGLGITFTEFVNQYRIEEARRVLSSAESGQIKVENLAYELGYKSKSAFFNSFKRLTDTTPARFRDSFISNLHESGFSR